MQTIKTSVYLGKHSKLSNNCTVTIIFYCVKFHQVRCLINTFGLSFVQNLPPQNNIDCKTLLISVTNLPCTLTLYCTIIDSNCILHVEIFSLRLFCPVPLFNMRTQIGKLELGKHWYPQNTLRVPNMSQEIWKTTHLFFYFPRRSSTKCLHHAAIKIYLFCME